MSVAPPEDRAEQEPPSSASLPWRERAVPAPLPVPLTPLVGRAREVTEVGELLRRHDAHLVTLVGAGGVGKTRLALGVAEAVRPEFADGVAFVPLAPLTDPALVLPAIAQAFGVPESGDRSPAEGLTAYLHAKRLLLVLDNFEHVIEAAPALADLLAAAPKVVALVTSRTGLRLSGERVVPVRPLPLPDRHAGRDPGRLLACDAVRLFVERAQAVNAGFALTAENAPTVAAICRRVDGLPLAIELAAARLSHLPPAALLARLERRLPLLTGGARDLPARQRTMRDAIAWSHDLLTAEEQALFRRLAVFAGGFTLDAAETVAGDSDGRDGREATIDVLDGVASLFHKSLLRREAASGDEPRYAMLETIREFGLEALAAGGETAAVRAAHAAFYLALAERAWPDLAAGGAKGTAWLDRLERELDNLRVALTGLEQAGDAAAVLRLAAVLGPFWLLRSHRAEGRAWLERALARSPSDPAPSDARGRALEWAAVLAFTQGDRGRAAELAEDWLARCRRAGDAWGIASAVNLLGAIARAEGDGPEAEARFAEALALFRRLGDRSRVALVLCNAGALALGQGDPERAAALLEEALALYRELDDSYWTAVVLSNLALVASDRGDRQRAAALYAESLARWRAVGTKEGLVDWLARVATLAATGGRPEPAARLFGAAEALREAIGYRFERPEQARYERGVAVARTAAGGTALAAAWAAGRALPLEAALVEATAFLDAPAAPPALAAAVASHGLTPRELEILHLVAEGYSDKEVAARLFISHRTAMRHMTNILAKLEVGSRTAAVAAAHRHGLLGEPTRPSTPGR